MWCSFFFVGESTPSFLSLVFLMHCLQCSSGIHQSSFLSEMPPHHGSTRSRLPTAPTSLFFYLHIGRQGHARMHICMYTGTHSTYINAYDTCIPITQCRRSFQCPYECICHLQTYMPVELVPGLPVGARVYVCLHVLYACKQTPSYRSRESACFPLECPPGTASGSTRLGEGCACRWLAPLGFVVFSEVFLRVSLRRRPQ